LESSLVADLFGLGGYGEQYWQPGFRIHESTCLVDFTSWGARNYYGELLHIGFWVVCCGGF